MEKYVAFIRAINVAGHVSVRMSDLRDAFAAAGCKRVSTFIQSGNVIFESSEGKMIFQRIQDQLRSLLGNEPDIFFRTAGEIEKIVRAAPFKDFEAEPGIKLYVAFLSRKPQINPIFPLRSSKEALEAIAMKNLEVFILSRRKQSGFYGFPNNFIEKELGVPATSRNRTTLMRIIEFIRKKP